MIIILGVRVGSVVACADIAGRVHDVDVSLALVAAGGVRPGAVGPSSACAVVELVESVDVVAARVKPCTQVLTEAMRKS